MNFETKIKCDDFKIVIEKFIKRVKIIKKKINAKTKIIKNKMRETHKTMRM